MARGRACTRMRASRARLAQRWHRLDADRKKAFEALCAGQHITASQVVRQLIRDDLARHGLQYARGNAQNAD